MLEGNEQQQEDQMRRGEIDVRRVSDLAEASWRIAPFGGLVRLEYSKIFLDDKRKPPVIVIATCKGGCLLYLLGILKK